MKNISKNSVRFFMIMILSMCYIILISCLSLMNFSNKDELPSFQYFDKIVHCCFYLGMNFLLLLLVFVKKSEIKRVNIIAATIIAIAYSFLIEILQPYFDRCFDWTDLIANSTGAFIAIPLILFVVNMKITRRLLGKVK